MADTSKHTSGPLHVSRLIQLLQQLHLSRQPVSAHNVAEKLGGLIDLSLSVGLADTLRGLKRIEGGEGEHSRDLLRQRLLEEREKWVAAVVSSCDPAQSSGATALPRLRSDYAADISEAAQPFARFYALQQSEMEHRIALFQRQVREVLSESSAAMAQLATLDKALFDILAQQIRRAFATLPPMIASHLIWRYGQRSLQADATADSAADDQLPDWFRTFLHDIREILLAELDIRLQPVIGLIEARESDTGL